jgi:hypothetical protein
MNRRGYCSVCGGALTNAKPCSGGEKVDKPIEFHPFGARSIASSFVMAHQHALIGATPEEINALIGQIGKVFWELNQTAKERVRNDNKS